ncbi:hypothetical protein Nepgr_022907 [Nepenthes gracilis]|uniref:Uncharacterized protein n=1 Tax=Nepenthes gracilis TaxID=150966 RepID=A0AAD3T0B7_NEPGR|nr:hypothetical protein Nepgr_022907 [Nepenthes gracilis]
MLCQATMPPVWLAHDKVVSATALNATGVPAASSLHRGSQALRILFGWAERGARVASFDYGPSSRPFLVGANFVLQDESRTGHRNTVRWRLLALRERRATIRWVSGP